MLQKWRKEIAFTKFKSISDREDDQELQGANDHQIIKQILTEEKLISRLIDKFSETSDEIIEFQITATLLSPQTLQTMYSLT